MLWVHGRGWSALKPDFYFLMCHPEACWPLSMEHIISPGERGCLAMQINAQSILISDANDLLTRGCADYLILLRWDTGQGQECLSFQGHSLHGSDKSREMGWCGPGKYATEPSPKNTFLVQPSLCSNVTAVGEQFMVEKTVWKAEFYFWVFF